MGAVGVASPAVETESDPETDGWLRDLRAGGRIGAEADARLRVLELEAARFEVGRRETGLTLGPGEAEQIAARAADEAVASVHARLGEFDHDRRFTTWARKYALRAAAVAMRSRQAALSA